MAVILTVRSGKKGPVASCKGKEAINKVIKFKKIFSFLIIKVFFEYQYIKT